MAEESESASLHLTIACGGTGGHFYPALAIAREHQRRGGQVTFLVAGHHADEQLQIAGKENFAAVKLEAVRLPRGKDLIQFPWRFLHSVVKARRILREVHTDVILGMGSFAAVPACLAASSLHIPLLLHEGNSLPGRANRMLSYCARALAGSLPITSKKKLHCKIVETGLPLRDSLLQAAGNRSAYASAPEHFSSLNRTIPTLLVFGGSQGAEFLNRQIEKAVPYMADFAPGLQFIHLTGSEDNQTLQDAYARAGITAVVLSSEMQMEACYQIAGLVICRAGAATISELALWGKAAILIPLPSSAENHQAINAGMVQSRNAGCFLPQHEAVPEVLASLIRDWLEHPDAWTDYARNIQKLARPDAAGCVIDFIYANTCDRRSKKD